MEFLFSVFIFWPKNIVEYLRDTLIPPFNTYLPANDLVRVLSVKLHLPDLYSQANLFPNLLFAAGTLTETYLCMFS